LLIIHGTGDDSGHYQRTAQLMSELIAHNEYSTAVPHPNRSHAISEGANTARHSHGATTRDLPQHLPVHLGQANRQP
jgi:dipeptidyl-peptidase-4